MFRVAALLYWMGVPSTNAVIGIEVAGMWRTHRQAAGDAPRVIVVGAGFAGMAAVQELARAGAQVRLIDRNVYSTFQPLLYQVATGGLNPGDVSYPARAFTRRHGARFRLGEVIAVDPDRRRVTLADGDSFNYDYLVLATGVSAAYYGVTGAAEHTLGLYTRRDAVELRNHIMARLERLDIAGPGKSVNFTVVGGGATGVELAGALAELRATALDAAFPEVNLAAVHIRLVEQAGALLLPFDPALREYARRQLEQRGVEVWLNTAIQEEVRSDRGHPRRRRGTGQRHHRMGRRGDRARRRGRMAAAAGPWRAHPHRARSAGARPGAHLRSG